MMDIRAPFYRSNKFISRSTFGRIFRLEGSGHEKEIKDTLFWTEVRAGITTFFTMYVYPVRYWLQCLHE
jgi:AGZA family xanthine/uracil permease-like MFS transporter